MRSDVLAQGQLIAHTITAGLSVSTLCALQVIGGSELSRRNKKAHSNLLMSASRKVTATHFIAQTSSKQSAS